MHSTIPLSNHLLSFFSLKILLRSHLIHFNQNSSNQRAKNSFHPDIVNYNKMSISNDIHRNTAKESVCPPTKITWNLLLQQVVAGVLWMHGSVCPRFYAVNTHILLNWCNKHAFPSVLRSRHVEPRYFIYLRSWTHGRRSSRYVAIY